MEEERLLTVMATQVEVPAVVERIRWPVHVTVVGNFRVDEAHTIEISALLSSVANHVAAFDVKLGPSDRFGSGRNIPVLLASDPTFHSLHDSLAAGLRDMPGFAAVEPSFWGNGYLPHATLGPAVRVRDGDALSFRALTLVSLHGNIGQRVSTVELS